MEKTNGFILNSYTPFSDLIFYIYTVGKISVFVNGQYELTIKRR